MISTIGGKMDKYDISDMRKRYTKYFPRDCNRILYRRIMGKKKVYTHYAGRSILNICEGNNRIYDLINKKEPFLAMRYGSAELSLITDLILYGKYKESTLNIACLNAGFFPPTTEAGKRFAEIMVDAAADVDIAALFYSFGEEFMLGEYSPEAILTNNRSFEPWYSPSNPWSKALEGMKVLIISPLAETIEEQYKKRESLFPNTEILPVFELTTLKAVQTIAGQKDERFETWFSALDYMENEAAKIDFDIAIVGCGAYGFPLSARLKRHGKQAIHLGGATQLLFGIKGRRWDNHPTISKLYNEYWVRPSEVDKPKNASIVENGCYW